MKKNLNQVDIESINLLDDNSLISKYIYDLSYFNIVDDLELNVYNGSLAKKVLFNKTFTNAYNKKHEKKLLLKKDTIIGIGSMQVYNTKRSSYNSIAIIYYRNVVFFCSMSLNDFEILKTLFLDITNQYIRSLKLKDLINI